MDLPRFTAGFRKARGLLVLAVTVPALVGIASPGFAAVAPVTLTLSTTAGANNGGGMITATTPTTAPTFFPGVDAEFQAAASATSACTPTYAAPVTPSPSAGGILDIPFVMVISANRIGINLPNFGSAPLGTKYNVCVYSTNNSSGQLLAQTASTGQFSIGARIGLGNVWPPAGPSQGGTTITVSGNNFPTTAGQPFSATLGGLPLLNIAVLGNNTFTAVTPPHAASTTPVPLIVSSASGFTVLAKAFVYANGITVSPNTGPNTRMGTSPVDVQGVGFAGLNFQMTGVPDDRFAHVYLVRGLYDPSNNGGVKRNGEVAECGMAMIVSDSELVCQLNLQASLTPAGATAMPTRTITADTHSDTTLANISPPLSISDAGERISGTGIAPGTSITSVGSGGTSAVLSVPTTATATGVTGIAVGVGTASASVTPPPQGPGPGQPSPPLTGITPALTQADIGRVVTGIGIPPGTTIMGLGQGQSPGQGQDGTVAYLSAPPTSAATGTTTSIVIGDAVPVPVGTYTITVVSNGTLAAWPGDQTYTQSVLSSGATFTVSDF